MLVIKKLIIKYNGFVKLLGIGHIIEINDNLLQFIEEFDKLNELEMAICQNYNVFYR